MSTANILSKGTLPIQATRVHGLGSTLTIMAAVMTVGACVIAALWTLVEPVLQFAPIIVSTLASIGFA